MSREHLIQEARAHMLGLNADEILELVKQVFAEKGYQEGIVLVPDNAPRVEESCLVISTG